MVDPWQRGLLDDAAPLAGGFAAAPAWLDAPYRSMIGGVVLPDDRLAAADRALPPERELPCRVINTGGAGGLVALARRRSDRLRPTGVRTALRDLDDLAGAVARVAVAARELDPDLTVAVELPDAPNWATAVTAAELEGLAAAVADGPSTGAGSAGTAERLSALIEADVPFVITGPVRSADRVIELITTVLELIDGEPPAAGVPSAEAGARLRRRLLGIEVADVTEVVDDLAARGWAG